MPYWVCPADPVTGARIVGVEEQLSPGPAVLEYPTEPAGVIVDTSDGHVVKQQPTSDPRRRVWQWNTMPAYQPKLYRFVLRLESLVSRTRREQGLSPYVYLKEDASNGLRTWDFQAGTASAVTANTLSDSGKGWTPNRYTNAVVEIVSGTGAGQRRQIASNTTNQLTLVTNWDTQPTGAKYALQASVSDWLKVRVLEVSKKPTGRGGLTYDPVRLVFVIEDAGFSDLG